MGIEGLEEDKKESVVGKVCYFEMMKVYLESFEIWHHFLPT